MAIARKTQESVIRSQRQAGHARNRQGRTSDRLIGECTLGVRLSRADSVTGVEVEIALLRPLVSGANPEIRLHNRHDADDIIQLIHHRAVFLLLPTGTDEPRTTTEGVIPVVALDFRADAITKAIA